METLILDSGVLTVLLMVAVPVVFFGGLYYQIQRGKKLEAWARSIGWTWVGENPALVHRWRGEPFGIGSSRRATEVIIGRFGGRPAVSFTYRYTTGSGKNRTHHTFHVVSVALPAYLPTLQLTPDGFGAKLAKTFGGQDIQFESEDFNQAWRVEAGVLKFAHDVVHPRVMERLMRPDARGTSLRIDGTDAISWTPGATQPDTVAPRLSLLCAVVDAIPRYVWLDHGYDPGPAAPGPGPGAGGPRPV